MYSKYFWANTLLDNSGSTHIGLESNAPYLPEHGWREREGQMSDHFCLHKTRRRFQDAPSILRISVVPGHLKPIVRTYRHVLCRKLPRVSFNVVHKIPEIEAPWRTLRITAIPLPLPLLPSPAWIKAKYLSEVSRGRLPKRVSDGTLNSTVRKRRTTFTLFPPKNSYRAVMRRDA
jgi:hypothetical protein